MNKKLFTTFTNAGYSCDKRFNPHVSILRGTKLPVDDILKRTRKLKMIGSTEFVDRISLNNMRAKDGNDYYKTESTVKLKEILECGNAYFNKDQESAQDQDNTLSLDDNLMNESSLPLKAAGMREVSKLVLKGSLSHMVFQKKYISRF